MNIGKVEPTEATPLHAPGQGLQSLRLPIHLYYVEKVESGPSMEAKHILGFRLQCLVVQIWIFFSEFLLIEIMKRFLHLISPVSIKY